MARRKKEAAKKAAKETSGSLYDWLKRWWASKHGLPETDSRLLQLTPGQLFQEVLEDYHARREDLLLQIPLAKTEERSNLKKQLAAIDQFLGLSDVADEDAQRIMEVGADPVALLWERELDAGRVPESLTRGLVKPKKRK